MFIVFLRFTEKKTQTKRFMQAHKDWVKQGFESGIFLMTGSIKPSSGGVILTRNIELDELQQHLNRDPFVTENIVTSEIINISPSQADQNLQFLLESD